MTLSSKDEVELGRIFFLSSVGSLLPRIFGFCLLRCTSLLLPVYLTPFSTAFSCTLFRCRHQASVYAFNANHYRDIFCCMQGASLVASPLISWRLIINGVCERGVCGFIFRRVCNLSHASGLMQYCASFSFKSLGPSFQNIFRFLISKGRIIWEIIYNKL